MHRSHVYKLKGQCHHPLHMDSCKFFPMERFRGLVIQTGPLCWPERSFRSVCLKSSRCLTDTQGAGTFRGLKIFAPLYHSLSSYFCVEFIFVF